MCRNLSAASFTACTTCGCAWPVLHTAMPAAKSRKRLPSTSQTCGAASVRHHERIVARVRRRDHLGVARDQRARLRAGQFGVDVVGCASSGLLDIVRWSCGEGCRNVLRTWSCEHSRQHRPAGACASRVRACSARSVSQFERGRRGDGLDRSASASGQPTAARASSTVASANSALSCSSSRVRMRREHAEVGDHRARAATARAAALARAPWPSRKPARGAEVELLARSCAATP